MSSKTCMLKLSPSHGCSWKWNHKEVMKLDEVVRVDPWASRIGVLLRRDSSRHALTVNPPPPSKWGHSKKVSAWKHGRELLTETKSASSMILDFAASRTMGKFLLFKPPYVVVLEQPKPTYTVLANDTRILPHPSFSLLVFLVRRLFCPTLILQLCFD